MERLTKEDSYFVVKNDEEQFSIWPYGRELPAGWLVVGESAAKDECLARIEQLWSDMRPLSVRRQLDAAAGHRAEPSVTKPDRVVAGAANAASKAEAVDDSASTLTILTNSEGADAL